VYNSTGQINSQTALPCFGATGLLTFEGKPSTVCADGSITEFGAASGSARYSSWAKPGTLVEPLPNGKLVIVDRSTAQVVVNDVHQNTVSAFSPQAPEINGAIQQMNSNLQAVAQAVPHVPVGRPIVAFDTASDSSGWYMLIWPYNKAIGPTVLKFDSSGNVTARLRCRVPRPELGLNLHWLKAQNGYLVLASGFGNVLVYALPNT
jgi:hypothetical protein